MKKGCLELVVFVCGAVVMILELVGSRILAPHLGTSLVVWTGLIGIVLASLSLGYWWGGRLADRSPNRKTLSVIALLAGLSIALTASLQAVVLQALRAAVDNIYVSAVFAATLLFGAPSVLLGMITPYAVKMKLEDLDHSGATVGRMYALSTVGSILGTFLAGFVLLAAFGCLKILVFLAGLMVGLSLLISLRPRTVAKSALLVLMGLGFWGLDSYERFMASQGVVDVDTAYNRILITEGMEVHSGRRMRIMATGPVWYQSAMYLDDPSALALEYTRFFRLVEHFRPGFRDLLMIGGGGYSFPKYLLKRVGDVKLDILEIDPAFTELAKTHFGFVPDDRVAIFHQDARTFLNRSGKTYDAVILDAFSSHYSVPFQLATVEAMHRLRERLNEDGVLVMNLISALTGPQGQFFRALHATLQAAFPTVLAFPVSHPEDGDRVQNIILVALRSGRPPGMENSDPHIQAYLDNNWKGDILRDLPILTDDFAPVERYLQGMAGQVH